MENIIDLYELSPMQQGMLFHSLYAPESGVYFEQRSCLLRGNLNVSAFKKAWQQVVDRHLVLRTAFYWEEVEKPLQVVYQQVELPWIEQDWQGFSDTEQREKLEVFLQTERSPGFNLNQPPLMRCALLKVELDAYYFVWSHHHLLMDGWCNALILKEVFAFYQAECQGKSLFLPPPRPYRNYIEWLQQQDTEAAAEFWRRSLQDFTAPTPLVVDSNVGSHQPGTYSEQLKLTATVTAALQTLAQQQRLTLNTIVQGAWAILLSRYSSETDIVFGATVSGRPPNLDGVESIVGLFINTLPVRVQVPGDTELLPWLQRLQTQQIERETYSYSSLVDIQQRSAVPRGLPLFESLVVFENYPVSIDAILQGWNDELQISDARGFERTNYPLTLTAIPDDVSLQISYDCNRFETASITRLLRHLQTLLIAIATNPQQRLSCLPLLTDAEQQLFTQWNETQIEYADFACIHTLFEKQVERTPDAIAVVFADQQLTYRELNTRANQLAHYLQTLGVKPDTLVGLCVERSPEMIIGLLGILKAGGAYLPLDPTYPQERLEYMLEDAQVKILIRKSEVGSWKLEVESQNLDAEGIPQVFQTPNLAPEHLAYVIYTSGSTGKPKGVMISHRSLANYGLFAGKEFGLGVGDRVLQFASISFDAAAEEIYPCLIHGATLVFRNDDWIESVPAFLNLCQKLQLTLVDLPSFYWQQLTRQMVAESLSLPESLRLVITGGEAVSLNCVELWQKYTNNCIRLLNTYGPTEATIVSTYWEVTGTSLATVPIGSAIANTQVYVLDATLNPVPIGVPGELYISGAGIARGYLNQPEQTALKFIPNPFCELESGQHNQFPILYKTGDRVRYLADGNIEFLGRIDNQVKLRGFRVELGEIEALLSQHPAIQAAVVTIKGEESDRSLVAYLVPSTKSELRIPASDFRSFLSQHLPSYMVPAQFVILDTLLLTPSGKIDRQALPIPENTHPLSQSHTLPRSVTEEILIGIWKEVLNLTQIGIHDNFFELGGHSLLATRVISQVRQAFAIELPLRRLFEKPTIAELAQEIDATTGVGLATPSIQPIPRPEILPLSFAQQRLWFLSQLEPDSPFYNIPAAVQLTGSLNINALQKSLDQILRRHEILRTVFPTIDGKPTQHVVSLTSLELPIIDLSGISTPAQELQVQKLAQMEAQQPFALNRSPLIRAKLIHLNNAAHVILLTLHHIIADGWSIGVLVRELATLYPAFSQEKPSLPPLPIQYADFAIWQREWLQGEVLELQLSYWHQQLKDVPTLLELPTDYPRLAVRSLQGGSHTFQISQELTQLKRLSQKSGSTLFMTLLAAWQIILYRYTGSEDIVVGTAIANRNHAEIEGLIGFFVNTLALRTDLSGDPSFEELLHRVREVTLGAYTHQDLPFEQLVETLQLERSLSYTPLFQVMFVLQAPMETLEVEGLRWSPIANNSNTAKFDLTLSIDETPTGLTGVLEYSKDLFKPETIERMAGHLQTLLNAIVAKPEQPLSELSILTLSEQQQLLVEWNQTQRNYPREMCVHQLFEAQATQTPDAIALVWENHQLTYQELNSKANQIAARLCNLGVQPGIRVGISIERSLEMIVGILAILKAGGTYIPLDPRLPQERLAFIVEDAQVSVLIQKAEGGSWNMELQTPNPKLQTPNSELLTPNSPAYIMYTSGSTGVPKGVCTTHRGIVRLVKACNYVNLDAEEIILQAAPLSFDASTFEIWGTLLNGGRLVIMSTSQPSLAELGQTIEQHSISTLWLTAGLFHLMVDEQLQSLKPIRQLLAGGDILSPIHVHKLQQAHPHCQLINGYGPTETTTFACCYPVPKNHPPDQPLAVGYPISNTYVYVLDRHLQLVPVGVPGELYIGGDGLASGYLNRPELTALKFLPNPFWRPELGIRKSDGQHNQFLTLYKSGDRVRYRVDGTLEYLGRLDDQVKIRGFRVELGEIETTLCQHPEVQAAVIIAQQNEQNNKRLIAYIVPTSDFQLSTSVFRQFLADRLPEYLVPSVFVYLEALPLTPNGKVDRRALPLPNIAQPTLDSNFTAPTTSVEKILAQIWVAILRVERVGIYDNFFELGGDSILAIQIISRANQAGIQLTPKQLFQHQTIAELAAVATQTSPILAEQGTVTGSVPLTPIQHWFFEHNLVNPHHFNQAVLLKIKAKLNLEWLAQALQQLLLHHDALRLRFEQTESGWEQHQNNLEVGIGNSYNLEVPLTCFDLSSLPDGDQQSAIATIINQIQTSFNLSTGPVVRVALFELGNDQPSRLLFVIHHLVIDGVSWRILLEDLQTAYEQLSRGERMQLPRKTTSFKQWAESLQTYADSADLQAQRDYWLANSLKSMTCLPVDNPTGANTIATADQVVITLSLEYTQALLKDVSQAYNTQINDILLTALVQAFADWTGDTSLLIDLEMHGRAELFEDINISRTVGWFTTLFPVQLDLEDNTSPGAALKCIKEQLRIPNQGIDYGVWRYLKNNGAIANKTMSQAEVSFNYLGQLDSMLAATSVFELADESPGITQDPISVRRYLLEINARVIEGKFQLIWTYSKQIHRRLTIINLANYYLKALIQLIEHCLSPDAGGYTPSDFSLAHLDQEQLKDLLNQVEFESS